MKIEELDFTVRTYNCLRRAGILTVEQLQEVSTLDLLKIRIVFRRGHFHASQIAVPEHH